MSSKALLLTNKYYLIDSHLAVACLCNYSLGASGPLDSKVCGIGGEAIAGSLEHSQIGTLIGSGAVKYHFGDGLLRLNLQSGALGNSDMV